MTTNYLETHEYVYVAKTPYNITIPYGCYIQGFGWSHHVVWMLVFALTNIGNIANKAEWNMGTMVTKRVMLS